MMAFPSSVEGRGHGGESYGLPYRLVIPSGAVGRLIGKRGAKIKEVREQAESEVAAETSGQLAKNEEHDAVVSQHLFDMFKDAGLKIQASPEVSV